MACCSRFLGAPGRTDFHQRILFCGLVTLVALGALVFRLWEVQVRDYDIYAGRLASRSEIRVRVPPVRGEIRDRNGIVLAENQSSFDVEFYLPEMVRAYGARYGNVPMTRYEGRVHDMAKMLREPDIVAIVDTAVIPRLREFGLPAAYDREALRRHFRTNAEVPFLFQENIGFVTVSQFSEHDLGLPGVQVAEHPVRHYPYGALAAHVLGYVGDPQDVSQLPDSREFAFYAPNSEGKAQIEQAADLYLRGAPGVRLMERNLKGVIDKQVGEEPSSAGDTVFLTLDARIQFIAEEALRAVGRGGAVVADPNSGEILAMASVPSFDPNTFVPSITADGWKHITDDPTDPLVNRAVCAFPPGSTFKAITALAGLRQGQARTVFSCSGGVSYGDHYFKCWNSHGHGRLTLSDAIKVSCNAYFYQYGNAAGIEAIDQVGKLLGLGQGAHLGLTGEETGILPGPEWLKIHSPTERWSAAQTANVSIGQGYDLVSPLQLVMAYSAIANGGTVYEPHLVGRIADPEGRPPEDPPLHFVTGQRVRGRLSDVGVNPADLDLVRTGFWKVVNEDGGTAARARLPGGIVAGKTGTAQAQLHGKQDTIAWFVGFAPFEHPRYAVCVMVQGGAHGGSVAAPIAARILERVLAMDEGAYQPPLAALPPARHDDPFHMIDAVKFETTGGHAVAAAGGGGNGDRSTPSRAELAARTSKARPAAPRLRGGEPERASSAPAGVQATPQHRNLFQWLFHPHGTS